MTNSENLAPEAHAAGHVDLVRQLADEEGLEETVARIVEIRDAMNAHFETEEKPDGFFESIIAAAPRLQRRVESVLSEHADLLRDLERLEHQVAIIQAAQADLAARKKTFLQTLVLHERTEADLQFEAYYVELGGGD